MSKLHRSMFVFLALATLAGMLGGCAGATPAATQKLAVGIVLPTKDEPRWIQDQTRFQEQLTAAGYDVEVLFSEKSSDKEKANVEALITKGVKVLIICPVDSKASAAAADAAAAAGIKVIAYDRLINGTKNVNFYVTFESMMVGAAWSNYLIQQAGSTKGNNLYLYAGGTFDNNAYLFFEGAWEAIQPKIADGTFIVKNSAEAMDFKDKPTLTHDEETTIMSKIDTKWDFNVAKQLAEADLTKATKADKGTVFIIAPNDGAARSIADAFRADKDVTKYYITGQDAEEASIQYIIDGKQSMTVLKDVRTMVKDAIAAAIAFLTGKTPTATKTYNNGVIDVPANPTAVVTVTKENVKAAVIDSGYWPAADFKNLP